ncbi:MAG: isocitrate lyase/phosphoenolpyruvate mutase family protein [Gemmatimonadota bacterium]|nr:isocitrate lyase/phosphoenolpyruvate mutase family protein [Gemmatimonadota bacterium]
MTHPGPESTTVSQRIAEFRRLHGAGCFVMPNPWDPGSARALVQLGFPAVATTSSGYAWSRGRADNHVSLDDALAHLRELSAAVPVPVNADFEGGFATSPAGVARNVAAAATTGVAGLSIEDSTGDAAAPLHDFELSVARIRAARDAIDRAQPGLLLTGRSEGFIVGRPDLAETVRRLRAYADAGADCVYAPGIRGREQVEAVVRAVSPTPVNVLVSGDWTTVAELAALGVRRISVGGALARVAWTAFLAAAGEMADGGTFGRMAGIVSGDEMNRRFGAE